MRTYLPVSSTDDSTQEKEILQKQSVVYLDIRINVIVFCKEECKLDTRYKHNSTSTKSYQQNICVKQIRIHTYQTPSGKIQRQNS